MSKSRNRKLIESLFKQIEKELGYHIVDKQFGNCYFIVESKEPDTICHFHIKELPGYLFGIWNICRYDTIQYEIENNLSLWSDNLHISSKSELIFFTQYEKEIDKFKPSRSGMVTGLRRITYKEDNKLITEWDIDELEVVLKYMKKHKYKSYVNIYNENKFVYRELSGITCFKIYYRDKWNRFITNIKDTLKLKIQIYKSKKLIKKLKDVYYYILDYGENCYPRIHIIVRRKPNIDIDTFIDNINTLQKFDYDNTDISVFWMDKDISERLNKKERQEDKDLLKRFNDIQSNLIEEADDPENDEPRILIKTNVK
jgi:hypothetical protein